VSQTSNGIILMDKPRGKSTAFCGRSIGKAMGGAKTGHCGTLDPIATGLIVLLVGRTTKLAQWFSGMDKEYEGVFRLGLRTSTADTEGEIIEEKPVEVGEDRLSEIAGLLEGERFKIPPVYSAIKLDGKPLYDYARKGKKVELKERRITIYRFEITAVDLPDVHFRARVSKGTYIRSLAEEFGEMAGCGAHVVGLRRTRIGRFDVNNASSFGELIDMAKAGDINSVIIEPNKALSHLPGVKIDSETAVKIATGLKPLLPLDSIAQTELFRIENGGRLVALARKTPAGFRLEKVALRPEEIENRILE